MNRTTLIASAAMAVGLVFAAPVFAAGTSEDTGTGYSGMKPGMSVNNAPADQPRDCADVKSDAVQKGGMKAGDCDTPRAHQDNSQMPPEDSQRDDPNAQPAPSGD